MPDFPTPPFSRQKQIPMPGRDAEMDPRPDYGETSYRGSGRLAGRKAIMGALRLYLDFINLFIMLLQLFGSRE